MKEIVFAIDPILSEKDKALVVCILEADKEGYYLKLPDKSRPLSPAEIQKLASPLDKQAMAFLTLKEKNIFYTPFKQSLQALKLIAATGKLFFNGKQIIADLYSSVPFAFHVEAKPDGKVEVLKKLTLRDQEMDLNACDYVGQGSPHWFIKGMSLRLIGSDVSWKDLKKETFSLSELKELDKAHRENPEEPEVIFKGPADERVKQQSEPLPLLILKDRTGAFADLWMDYGDGRKISFHDPLQHPGAVEKAWEKDLLETDFIRKPMDNSQYYCPLNRVAKSLTFLLEIGWTILDWKGKKLVRFTDMDLSLQDEGKTVAIRGKITFEEFQTDLTAVAGAFNRRERFVQIGVDAVGLLPDQWNKTGFDQLLDEAEIVSDKLSVKRHAFGILSDLLSSGNISHGTQLEKLKDFHTLTPCLPGKAFKGTLRPYQQEGLNWLNFLQEFGFHGILADDMGLGKTVQVLAFLSQAALLEPVLIVMPTSLIFNWHREILRFLPEQKVYIHHGPQRTKTLPEGPVIVLTTYNTLRIDLPLFAKHPFSCVILDEAQAIKNAHAQVSQAVCSLQSKFRLSITGTPIENHLGELWSHFKFLMPELLGDEEAFLADVQTATSDGRYYQRIKKKIRPFILRRKKEEVAKDLPECIEQIVWVEMEPEQRQAYENYLSGIKGNLIKKVEVEGISKHRMEVFEAILRLRQICCHPLLVSAETGQSGKLDSLLEDIETAISEGRKILVYSQFTSMLHLIAKSVKERGWNHVYLDGETKNREKVVSQFQDDPTLPLFLISLKAGGVGLNLTAADYVFLYDPWWNNAVEDQAIGRAHRIGRKDTVIAKKYIAIESIEEKILKLKENKKNLIADILDDSLNNANLTEDDLRFLIS